MVLRLRLRPIKLTCANAHPADRAAANDLRHNGRSGSTAPAPRAPPRRRPTPGRAAAPPVAAPVGPCQGARVSIPIALATPLYLFYEGSILIGRLLGK